jgi:hypothetical protein
MTATGIIPQNNPAPISLTFALRVKAMGKARPIVTGTTTFMPKDYEAWRSTVRWMVRSQVPASALPRLPLTGRLAFSARFSAPLGVMKCDIDNAIGALFDAIQVPPRRMSKGKVPVMKGGGWGLIANDSQVKRLSEVDIVAGPTCITFTVSEIP